MPDGSRLALDDVARVKQEIFRAILDEERLRLKEIPDQFETLTGEIDRIGAQPQA